MSDDTDEALLPCPFCGSKAFVYEHKAGDKVYGHWVTCSASDCTASIDLDIPRDEAIRRWNLRTEGRP